MGTNFYVVGHTHTDDPKWHIGKRSAAGWYCWDCNVTLCIGGEERVHYGDGFHDKCPKCGKGKTEESIFVGSVGRELGFNKAPFARRSGVSTCSSFTWARNLGRLTKIQDEYGTIYTREQFDKMLSECPIQYDRKGTWFC